MPWHAYGFKLGDYDRSRPLVLDPAVFVYAGYIGGDNADRGRGIAVDKKGNAYVTGITASPRRRICWAGRTRSAAQCRSASDADAYLVSRRQTCP